jgi:twitching motility protein PilT
MSRLDTFLKIAREQRASDIHFAVGRPPLLRLHGNLEPISYRDLEETELRELLVEVLNRDQLAELDSGHDLDLSYSGPGVGRFRANVFRRATGLGAVFRIIPTEIPSIEQLGLPPVILDLVEAHAGMLLVTGAAGTGKTTTLSALVDHINQRRAVNIIALEDPVEVLHESRKALVIQREVGTHVESFEAGLRAALREDPDVILVGEMRDLETISLAMTAAETGHLVMGTLHTSSAAKTLDRILDAMPAVLKAQAAVFLAQHLRGVVSQRLLRSADGRGRRAVVEVMVSTPAISNLILTRKTFLVPDQLRIGGARGMQLMDQALLRAVREGSVDPNEAYLHALDKKAFEPYVTDPTLAGASGAN